MAKCMKCGTEIPAGVDICHNCVQDSDAKPKRKRGRTVLLTGCAALIVLCALCSLWVLQTTLNGVRTGKIKRAMSEVRTLATACLSYQVDKNGYPIQEKLGPVAGIQKSLLPDYLKELPPYESEVGEYLYMSMGNVQIKSESGSPVLLGTDFLLIWTGLDGKLDSGTAELLKLGLDGKARIWTMPPRRSTGSQDDIIWVDDHCTQYAFMEPSPPPEH